MKRLNLIPALILLTSLFACEPPVTFNEPQPANTNDLSSFPKRLQGQYLSLEDSSILSIHNQLILRTYDFEYKIHPSQLDADAQLSGDTIIDPVTNERTIAKRDGDSLITRIHYVDTLFSISHDGIVRKFKGHYFLNSRYDEASWRVKQLRLKNGQLVISRIPAELKIESLQEIKESPNDTIPPRKFAATKKQFKDFVKNDGFSDSEVFVRQAGGSL